VVHFTADDHEMRFCTQLKDKACRNARKNSDKPNARIENDKALAHVMTAVLKDDTELFKQFMDNEPFKGWITDTVFGLTCDRPQAGVPGL
jgi:type I restriction enzyme, R subunit